MHEALVWSPAPDEPAWWHTLVIATSGKTEQSEVGGHLQLNSEFQASLSQKPVVRQNKLFWSDHGPGTQTWVSLSSMFQHGRSIKKLLQ